MTSSTKAEGLLSHDRVTTTLDEKYVKATTGDTSVRLLAFASGLALVVSSFLIWTLWIVDHRFSWIEFLASAIGFCTGLYAFILESNFTFVREYRSNIVSNAPFFGRVSTRGIMYSITGLLQCAVFTPLHVLVGLCTGAVGVYLFKIGQTCEESLAKLRASITDEKALLASFQTGDSNGDGMLEAFEFEALIWSLGMELTSDELEAAFSSIDTNNDKKITYDEFRSFWKVCSADAQEKASSGQIV